MLTDDIVQRWREALESAYRLAYGDRLQELRDRRPSLLDNRGLNPFSLEVGRIYALQELMPELREHRFDPVSVRRAGKAQANLDFAKEVYEREQQSVRDARPEDSAGDGDGALGLDPAARLLRDLRNHRRVGGGRV